MMRLVALVVLYTLLTVFFFALFTVAGMALGII